MNTFGRLFRVSLFGESHGQGVGVVVDGVPAGLELDEDGLAAKMARRRPGAELTSPRQETDAVTWLSGTWKNRTTGAPVAMWIANEDARPSKEDRHQLPRPGHADFALTAKTDGFADLRGGGHASGRLTAALVAAGHLAERVLLEAGVDVAAHTHAVGDSVGPDIPLRASAMRTARPPTWTAHRDMEETFVQCIEAERRRGDSIGGQVAFVAEHLPAGLGEPFFDGLDATLGHLLFSIPAVKAVEFGAGTRASRLRGSQHNDAYEARPGGIGPATNHAGGLLGGITTGEALHGRVSFKPTSSIRLIQHTVDRQGKPVELSLDGRNDPCIAIRGVAVVEACVKIALADAWLCQRAFAGLSPATRGSTS